MLAITHINNGSGTAADIAKSFTIVPGEQLNGVVLGQSPIIVITFMKNEYNLLELEQRGD